MINYIKKFKNKNMLKTITISSKGQITIPEQMRKNLNIKDGATVAVVEEDHKLILGLKSDLEKELKKTAVKRKKDGWLALAEKSMAKIWDNCKDEKIWGQYLAK